MIKFITCIYIIIVIMLVSPAKAAARDREAEESASLKNYSKTTSTYDYRVDRLESFLSVYKSPLSPYASYFVQVADLYQIDYRLVPAISGVESTFGKRIPAKSFNAYGWSNGEYRFKSWPDSINHVTFTLRTKYVDRGAPSINKIARRYAPPSPLWGSKVKFFMGKIDTLPLAFDIIS